MNREQRRKLLEESSDKRQQQTMNNNSTRTTATRGGGGRGSGGIDAVDSMEDPSNFDHLERLVRRDRKSLLHKDDDMTKVSSGKIFDKEDPQELRKRMQRLGILDAHVLKKGQKLGTESADIDMKEDSGIKKRGKDLLIDGMTRPQYFASRRMKSLLQHVMDTENRNLHAQNVEIVRVEMSKDYKSANVKWREKYGFLPYKDMKTKNSVLQRISGFLGSRVGTIGELRYAPRFEFFFDIDPRDTSITMPKSYEEQMAEMYESQGFLVERPEPPTEEELRQRFVRYEDEQDLRRKAKRRARAQEKSEKRQDDASQRQLKKAEKRPPSKQRMHRLRVKRSRRRKEREIKLFGHV